MNNISSKYIFQKYMENMVNDFNIQDYIDLLDSYRGTEGLGVFIKEVMKIKINFIDQLIELSNQYLESELDDEEEFTIMRLLTILDWILVDDEENKLRVQQIRSS